MNPAPRPPFLAYRGMTYSWECDQMGHMSTRFYFARIEDAMTAIASELHLPDAFCVGGGSTLRVTDQHGRFRREARDGHVLSVYAGVLEIEPRAAKFLLLFRHFDGAVAAGFTVRAEYLGVREGIPCEWPARARDALDGMLCSSPPEVTPRTLGFAEPAYGAHLDVANAFGMPTHGRAAVHPDQCDAHGRMRLQFYMGRFSEFARRSEEELRALYGAETHDEKPKRLGRALLEHRALYRRWPQAGDGLLLRTALVEANSKYDRLAQWMLSPLTGEAWAEIEMVVATIDLDTRRLVPANPAALAALNATAIDLRTRSTDARQQ